MRRLLAIAGVAAALAASPAGAETVAITNARLLTMGPAGEIPVGVLVMQDGKIIAVGKDVAPPAGARIVDAGGAIVTPGVVASDVDFGLTEVEAVGDTVDTATRSEHLSAAFDVRYGLDPFSVVIPVARLGGVTRAIVTPRYRNADDRELLFAGQAAVVHLGQGVDMLVQPGAAMVLDLGAKGAARAGGARGAAFVALKAALGDVRWYMRNRQAFDRGEARQLDLSRADLEALIPVVRGEMPVMVRAHRAADILQVLDLAKAEGLKVILEGAQEGWMVAGQIAAAGVPVILDPTDNLPASFEMRAATMENAARLHRAGVLIALEGGGGGHRARETRYNAGIAVANGLPYDAALKAITVNPARIFGLSDRFGALQVGRDADVVIWSGDPLEPLTHPTAVFIRGEQQPMTSRALELRDRYKSVGAAQPSR